MALVIHELTTNSAIGALSDSRGRVAILTSRDETGNALIEWKESGGPPVKAPTRRGFGSTVIEQAISHDLQGKSRIEFVLASLRASFLIPARHVHEGAMRAMPAEPASPVVRAFDVASLPSDVLIAEDILIIALDLESVLRNLGVKTVRVTSSVDQALIEINRKPPEFGFLDVNLKVETSFDIAARLAQLEIPFCFATGYGEQVVFPEDFGRVLKLREPYSVVYSSGVGRVAAAAAGVNGVGLGPNCAIGLSRHQADRRRLRPFDAKKRRRWCRSLSWSSRSPRNARTLH